MNRFLQLKSAIWWLLGFNLVLRLVIMLASNLGNDEVYYVLYALYPDWSYFDHPPLVGMLIRLSTFNLKLISSDFFVRLGALVLGTVNLYLIYEIGKLLKDRLTGLLAALLLSASIYSSIIVGSFILPDTPQSTFWILSLFLFVKWLQASQKEWYLLVFGFTVGLAMLSKYHAVYLWFGVLLYLLVYDRKSFLKPYVWLSGLISLLVFSPVVFWNLTSKYSGIAYHANRVGNDSFMPTIKYFFPEFFGQAFYNNPFNFYLIVFSLIILYRKRKTILNSKIAFLMCVSLPLVVTTLGMSFFNRTLPHWSGPSYFGLVLVVAYVFRLRDGESVGNTFKRVIIYGHALVVALVAFALVQINAGVLGSGQVMDETRLGKNDFTIDIGLWDEISDTLEEAMKIEIQNQGIAADYAVITHNWFPASHLDFYYAIPNQKRVFVFGKRENLHMYLKVNNMRGRLRVGDDAVYITTSHYYTTPDKKLTSQFKNVSKPMVIPVVKNGTKRVNLFVWKLIHLNKELTLLADQ